MTALLLIVSFAAVGIAICAVGLGYGALSEAATLRKRLDDLSAAYLVLNEKYDALASCNRRVEQDWAREIRTAVEQIKSMLGLSKPSPARPHLVFSNDRSPERSA